MSLDTLTNLKTAIQNEADIDDTAFTNAIDDFILRAEVKVNRKVRLREMEQLAYKTYTANATTIEDRRVSVPSDYVEIISLWSKVATGTDSTFARRNYVSPVHMPEYYDSSELVWTLRKEIEFNIAVSQDHEVMIHYLKRWDLANEATGKNWLLTNYPDVYLYGALAESEMFMVDDKRVAGWKGLFEQALGELELLSDRGRNDSVLQTSHVSELYGRRGRFDVIRGV